MITRCLIRKGMGDKKGFTLTEVMITFALFIILASLGMGAYFRYYKSQLVNDDISEINRVLHDARFKATKNPYNSDYGIHLSTATAELIVFRSSYSPGNPQNETLKLQQLAITQTNLLPTPGTTKDILFKNVTGKTSNSGSFTVGSSDFSYTFNINTQGVFE